MSSYLNLTFILLLSISISFPSLADGSVVAGRIQVILDDILWVATLPQVRSAIVFYRHLTELINKAAEMAKAERAQKAWREVALFNNHFH